MWFFGPFVKQSARVDVVTSIDLHEQVEITDELNVLLYYRLTTGFPSLYIIYINILYFREVVCKVYYLKK